MKKTLAILLALVLCLGVCSFIACEKDDGANVPVEEGKVTLYFELAEGSVEIPSFASVYFAGGQFPDAADASVWATGLACPEFKNVEGTNLYYIQIEYNPALDNSYQLVLGYNTTSGLPDDKCGLQWVESYKSDECAQYAFGDNATFEYKDGAKKISLGTHTFSTAVAAPKSINTEIRVTFSESLGENAEVYFMGSFVGWDMAKAKATASDDRTVYSLALTDVLCSNYEYKILVVLDKTAATTTKDDADLGIWDWNMTEPEWPEGVEADEESVMRAYIEIGPASGNLPLTIFESDEGSYIDLVDTISETNPARDEVKTGLNLAQIDLVEGESNGAGNNIFTWKYQMSLPQKTLIVNFTEALPEKAELYIFGSLNGWNAAFEAGEAKMTIASDRMSASITLEVIPGSYEANIIAVHADYQVTGAQAVYDNGVKINQGEVCLPNGNLPIVVTGFANEDIELFEEAQAVPTLTYAPIVTVTFQVTFSEALTGKEVYMAGTINSWGFSKMTANDDNTVFTLTMDVNAKEQEFAILVCDEGTAANWNNKLVANAPAYGGNDNATVEIPTTGGTVILFPGLTLVGPEA